MTRIEPAQIPENAIVLDVRDELEAAASPLSRLTSNRVVHLPLSELEDGAMPELPEGARVVVVCNSGAQGELAGAYLEVGGVRNVSVLDGGARGWRRDSERLES
jgi:rhodanese-related sulfurtransferase